MDCAAAGRSLQIIAEADFPFEFLTYTRHLPYVLQALERIGALRAVIDHISKPEIKTTRSNRGSN